MGVIDMTEQRCGQLTVIKRDLEPRRFKSDMLLYAGMAKLVDAVGSNPTDCKII